MVKINGLPTQWRKKAIEEKLKDICENNDVVFLGLFGSFAAGKATSKSDVDILVRFDAVKEKSLLDLIRTQDQLKKVFKRKVDLLTEGSLSPYLKDDILKSVAVIYEKR